MSESVLASFDAPSTETAAPEAPAPEPAAPSPEVTPTPGVAPESPAKAEKPVQTVPLAALQESRERIKALTAQIDELKKQPQLSAEDRELLSQLRQQREDAKKPKPPEFLEDPKGYIDAKEREVSEALKQLREDNTKRTEAEQQQQQLNTLLTTISGHEQAFVAANPDYQEALSHVRSVRAQQLKMMFPDATDAQVQQQIAREELGGAAQILQRGGNPAEFAYNYAKTLGYVKKVAPPALANAASIAEPEPKPDKDAVRSLGGGGGAEPDTDPADPMPEFTAALRERFTRKRK